MTVLTEMQTQPLPLGSEPVPLYTDDASEVRVGDTRVTLDTVVETFEYGATAEEIALKYPSLRLADVYAVISYYLRHQPAVQTYLAGRHDLEEQAWREDET